MLRLGFFVLFFVVSSALPSWAQRFPDANGEALRGAEAQESSETLFPFLESSDFFVTTGLPSVTGFGRGVGPFDDTRLEANIYPHLKLFGNVASTLPRGSRRYLVSVTPAVRLRMLNESSAPVLSPSYMPRLNMQWFFAGHGGQGPIEMEVWEAHLMVGHHSNGQSGCLFIGQDQHLDCLPTLPQLIDELGEGPDFDIRGASFSTNYVRSGAIVQLDAFGLTNLRLGGDVEVHFATDAQLRPFYGRFRGEIGLSVLWLRLGDGRCVFSAGGRFSDVPSPESIGARYGAGSLFIPAAASWYRNLCYSERNNWGLYVGAYQGQDYYNIGFLAHIARYQFGATYSMDTFFRFSP